MKPIKWPEEACMLNDGMPAGDACGNAQVRDREAQAAVLERRRRLQPGAQHAPVPSSRRCLLGRAPRTAVPKLSRRKR